MIIADNSLFVRLFLPLSLAYIGDTISDNDAVAANESWKLMSNNHIGLIHSITVAVAAMMLNELYVWLDAYAI